MGKPSFANPEFEEQLLLLRAMTERTQVLHEAQILQLKMWPLTLFTHARGVELQISFEKKEITFVLKTKGKVPDDIEERYGYLNTWVKWLLGNDWIVRVRAKNKQVYRAGRTV